MNNRELLEMAAKAAGHYVQFSESWNDFLIEPIEMETIWNPLTYDDDALRLAIKLQLQIRPNGYDVMVVARLPSHIAVAEACDHKDPYAATRRAIVKAAAEIGRGMK